MVKRIQVHLHTLDGQLHSRTAEMRPEWPHLAINSKDRQVYYLGQDPILYRERPVRFDTWEEFVGAAEPLASLQVNNPLRPPLMVAEHNNYLPLTRHKALTREELAGERRYFYETAYLKIIGQTADAAANANHSINHFCMVIAGGAAAIMGIIAIVRAFD